MEEKTMYCASSSSVRKLMHFENESCVYEGQKQKVRTITPLKCFLCKLFPHLA